AGVSTDDTPERSRHRGIVRRPARYLPGIEAFQCHLPTPPAELPDVFDQAEYRGARPAILVRPLPEPAGRDLAAVVSGAFRRQVGADRGALFDRDLETDHHGRAGRGRLDEGGDDRRGFHRPVRLADEEDAVTTPGVL